MNQYLIESSAGSYYLIFTFLFIAFNVRLDSKARLFAKLYHLNKYWQQKHVILGLMFLFLKQTTTDSDTLERNITQGENCDALPCILGQKLLVQCLVKLWRMNVQCTSTTKMMVSLRCKLLFFSSVFEAQAFEKISCYLMIDYCHIE